MLRREAATWLARLQSGRDPQVERRFERWRDADPRHREAFARVQRSYEQAGLLRHSLLAGSTGATWAASRPTRRPVLTLAGGAAAAIVFSAGVLALFAVLPLGGGIQAMTLVTKAGEIRRVRLADGSNVTLDTSTRLDLELGRVNRNAHLRYGRARFEVVPWDQPFVVETAGATVSTDRGVIEVAQAGRQGHVEVLAGSAKMQGEGEPPLELGPGQGVAVDPAGKAHVERVGQAPNWAGGMLQFDRTQIADAVGLANRYSDRKILLAGDLGPLRVSGAFRAGDTAGLAKALAAAFGLRIDRDAAGSMILTAPLGPEKKWDRVGKASAAPNSAKR